MKIPFNLHDAIDGKPVINGMGEDFEFSAYYPASLYPVVGRINNDIQSSYTKDGRDDLNKASDRLDLFMKPEKITKWIVVGTHNGFSTKDLAMQYVNDCRTSGVYQMDDVAIVKVEFYPGEGIE